ncbi:carbohydrate sulfotransferase 11-like [Mya arenaria]|uniref:carbohydrate sulfotransferase 11-like n=1 Tax=Mya arenaria TaxID=6604 RepID=UPI0022E117DF|nr:carbohydrate sulfotransferase 11-like [Mya arenaria]
MVSNNTNPQRNIGVHDTGVVNSVGRTAPIKPYSYARKEIFERRERVRNYCKQNAKDIDKFKTTGSLWTVPDYDIHWCVTQKIGSTHWKQVLRFVAGDYSKDINVTKPEDLDRFYVHSTQPGRVLRRSLANIVSQGVTLSGKVFMFTREPYSRLWSAYIDKFLLPDFWEKHAPFVVRKVRSDVKEQDTICASDVTFSEFLIYIVLSNSQTLDPHWRPVFHLCNPCRIKYDVIGKQETFANDSNLILNKFGLDTVVPKSTSTKTSRATEEITMLVQFNFDLENRLPVGCFDKEDVAIRLWKAFQYNGYIHRSIDIPMKSMHSENFLLHPTEVFLKHAFGAINYQNANNYDLQNQKRDMMLDAYKSISRQLVNRIKEVYKYDFELFGYDKDLLMYL